MTQVADYLSVLLAIQYSKELDFLYLFTLDPDILYQTTTLTYPSASEIMSLRSADPKDKRSSFKELQTSLHGVRFPRCSLNILPCLSLPSIRNQDDNWSFFTMFYQINRKTEAKSGWERRSFSDMNAVRTRGETRLVSVQTFVNCQVANRKLITPSFVLWTNISLRLVMTWITSTVSLITTSLFYEMTFFFLSWDRVRSLYFVWWKNSR